MGFFPSASSLYVIAGNFYYDSSGNGLKFNERDGSTITIKPEFESQSKKYASLYEKMFNKEVTVRIVPGA